MFLMDNIKLDSIPNTNEIYKPVLHCISSSEGTNLALRYRRDSGVPKWQTDRSILRIYYLVIVRCSFNGNIIRDGELIYCFANYVILSLLCQLELEKWLI